MTPISKPTFIVQENIYLGERSEICMLTRLSVCISVCLPVKYMPQLIVPYALGDRLPL